MKLTSVLSVFLSLAIISHGAPVNFSKRSFGNESSPQAVNIFQELKTITQGTDKEAEGADLSVGAIEALFADAPACDQQDKADEIIDLGHTLGGEKEKQLIQIAITYRQLERNTPEAGQPSELCSKPPKNKEIIGLLQAQDLAGTTTPDATPYEPDPDSAKTATTNEPDPDDSAKTNEPDPDDSAITATPNEPDPDDSAKAPTQNEPDPDDSAKTNEPDPDDSAITATQNEPDPDDSAKTNEPDPDDSAKTPTPNEPDPDDSAKTNEPDPDDSAITATPNEPDPDDSAKQDKGNEPDPDDSDKNAPPNKADQDDSSSASNDDSGNVLPKDPDEDSEHNNDGSSAKSNMPQDFA